MLNRLNVSNKYMGFLWHKMFDNHILAYCTCSEFVDDRLRMPERFRGASIFISHSFGEKEVSG